MRNSGGGQTFLGTRLTVAGSILFVTSLVLLVVAMNKGLFHQDQAAWLFAGNSAAVLLLALCCGIALRRDSTRRKSDEEALRESSEFSHQVIAGVREGIAVFDRELRYVVFNPFMEELSTWRAAEVLGKTIDELMPAPEGHLITERLHRALQGETVYSGDEFIPGQGARPDGWVTSKLGPLRNSKGEIIGVIAVLNDINERKQAEQQALESAAFTSRVIADIESGIAVFDRDMRYLAFNPFLERVTGWRAEDVIGKPVTVVAPSDHVTDVTDRLRRALQGEVVYSGDRFLAATEDHPDLWFNTRVSPLRRSDGAIIAAVMTVNNITEHKKIEELAERTAAIVRTSNDAIIAKDLNGVIQSWNNGAEKLFGYRAAEIIGQSICRLIPAQHLHEEDEIMWRVRHGLTTEAFETVRQTRDGQLIDVSLMISPIMNAAGVVVGASKVARDISERKRVEAALRERESQYRELFLSSPLPMLVVDQETLSFIAVNDAATAHYGYSREEFLALTIRDIRPEEDVPAALMAMARKEKGVDELGVWRHRTKSGRLISVKISTHLLTFQGRPAKMVLINDVTEQLAAQLQIEELNTTLEKRIQERTAELAAKSKELESFCYSVSHDLKAPLRGIDGYSRLLMEDHFEKMEGEGRKFLQNIRSATQQMTELIDDLLTYSRQERRAQVARPIELQGFVKEQLQRSAALLSRVDLTVSVDVVHVLADFDALQIALRNLLDNAVKFSSQSTNPTIRIRSQVQDQVCVLVIEDNGVGFDMRFYDRIFEIFQRLHRAEDFPGTGIGLAMVRKVMERSGGRVWAESQPGQGATFYLEIPLAGKTASLQAIALSSPLESLQANAFAATKKYQEC